MKVAIIWFFNEFPTYIWTFREYILGPCILNTIWKEILLKIKIKDNSILLKKVLHAPGSRPEKMFVFFYSLFSLYKIIMKNNQELEDWLQNSPIFGTSTTYEGRGGCKPPKIKMYNVIERLITKSLRIVTLVLAQYTQCYKVSKYG